MKALLNKIHCAECLEFMRKLPDKCVDLVLTDPPYGINITEEFKKDWGDEKAKKRVYKGAAWDACTPSAEYFTELLRVGKNAIIFGGNYFAHMLPPSRCWLVWDKLNGTSSFADCELCWTSFTSSVRKFEHLWNGLAVQNKSDREDRFHPTQKPVGLIVRILEKYARPGQIILDPFSGSGTTAVACHKLGLDFVCVERDAEYWAASCKRLEKERQQARLDLFAPPPAVQAELW